MFKFIKKKLTKIYDQVTNKINSLFLRETIDKEFFKDLEKILICADTGVLTTKKIIDHLSNLVKDKKIDSPIEIKDELKKLLINILNNNNNNSNLPKVVLLVGINGSGKTSFAGKLANLLKNRNKKVLLVAGDTFRAAAVEQLQSLGEKVGVEVLSGKENQDPASVIFDGCKKFNELNYDHLIIDTAGRLQTKANLMKELSKIKKIIDKHIKTEVQTWLTVDSMLGQNSFEQAKEFKNSTNLDGIVLTKLDGTGKGGIIFSITNELHLPVIYVTFGERIDSIREFNSKEYVSQLLEQDFGEEKNQ